MWKGRSLTPTPRRGHQSRKKKKRVPFLHRTVFLSPASWVRGKLFSSNLRRKKKRQRGEILPKGKKWLHSKWRAVLEGDAYSNWHLQGEFDRIERSRAHHLPGRKGERAPVTGRSKLACMQVINPSPVRGGKSQEGRGTPPPGGALTRPKSG